MVIAVKTAVMGIIQKVGIKLTHVVVEIREAIGCDSSLTTQRTSKHVSPLLTYSSYLVSLSIN